MSPQLQTNPPRLALAILLEHERKEPLIVSSAGNDRDICTLHDWIDSQQALRSILDRALAAQSDAEGEGDL